MCPALCGDTGEAGWVLGHEHKSQTSTCVPSAAAQKAHTLAPIKTFIFFFMLRNKEVASPPTPGSPLEGEGGRVCVCGGEGDVGCGSSLPFSLLSFPFPGPPPEDAGLSHPLGGLWRHSWGQTSNAHGQQEKGPVRVREPQAREDGGVRQGLGAERREGGRAGTLPLRPRPLHPL